MAEERTVQELMGAPGSPYTRKMLAVMRYRNIPYRLERQSRFASGAKNPHYKERAQPKVHLLPTYYFKDDKGEEVAVTDSTPLIRRFEKEYEGRNIVPSDPALRFINDLLEDFGDEWLTKAMFHYRWHYDADIKKGGDILPRWGGINQPEDQARAMGDFIRERQIERLSYVGSNDITKTTIEESFKRIVTMLDAHLTEHPFLMGERPGSADFAIYGQLTCLALFDPTPQAWILENAPRVYAWVEVVEDLSGYLVSDDDWLDAGDLPETLKALLGEVGRVYAPYLIANAKAVMGGAGKMEMTLDGRAWEQNPFTYQAKCLQWIREDYAALDGDARSRVDAIINGTGIEELFA